MICIIIAIKVVVVVVVVVVDVVVVVLFWLLLLLLLLLPCFYQILVNVATNETFIVKRYYNSMYILHLSLFLVVG